MASEKMAKRREVAQLVLNVLDEQSVPMEERRAVLSNAMGTVIKAKKQVE